jgi:hypothetical protein
MCRLFLEITCPTITLCFRKHRVIDYIQQSGQ